MNQKMLLAVRKKAKKRKPFFVVKEYHDTARIKKRWRRPRGIHSAQRQYHHGKPACPNPGYSSPAAVRGFHPLGLLPVVVSNTEQLLSLTPAQGAIISASVGNKRRLELLALAQEKKMVVLNIKDSSSTIQKITSAFQARQQQRQERTKSKEKKETEKKKKAEEKVSAKREAKEVSLTPQEKKEAEREMLEKTLTKPS